MKLDIIRRGRTKSGLNLITGLTHQVINTFLGLVLPYLFITQFGSETNGLLNSIAQLFVYLQILEAGVGAASRQALYKPLANDQRTSVNEILSATSKYYKKTGIIYLLAIIVLSFVYPLLVDTKLSSSTITLVIFLQGLSSAWGYFVQAKYSVLLKADGRVYVLNILMLCSSILRNAAKIIAIYLGYSIIVVQACNLVVAIFESFIVIIYFHIKYKWVNFHTKPDFQAINQKNSVLIQWIAWLIFNHTDVVLLTVMSRDLTIVSVYSIYLLAFTAIQNVLESIRNSYQFKIGQKYAVSKDIASDYFRKYRTLYTCLSFILCTTCYVMVTPFVKLYTYGVTDADYLVKFVPELFFFSQVLYSVREVYRQAIEASGHFKSTKYIVITEMIFNLALSIALIPSLGIKGALIGTTVALIVGLILLIHYDNKYILVRQKSQSDVFYLFALFFIALVFFGLKGLLINNINSYISLITRALLVFTFIGGLFACLALVEMNISKKKANNKLE